VPSIRIISKSKGNTPKPAPTNHSSEREHRRNSKKAEIQINQKQIVTVDAAAVAAYHAETYFPVVQILVCDDASQFNWLSREIMLCWEHEGRHYKKLIPPLADMVEIRTKDLGLVQS